MQSPKRKTVFNLFLDILTLIWSLIQIWTTNWLVFIFAVALLHAFLDIPGYSSHPKLNHLYDHRPSNLPFLWASCQIRKLQFTHAPGMPGTSSPPPRVSDPNMHHGTCVTHVPWCIPGLLTSGFLWSWWLRKSSRQPQHMRNPQFYVSGKRPISKCTHRNGPLIKPPGLCKFCATSVCLYVNILWDLDVYEKLKSMLVTIKFQVLFSWLVAYPPANQSKQSLLTWTDFNMFLLVIQVNCSNLFELLQRCVIL